jgi:hypothetical protein
MQQEPFEFETAIFKDYLRTKVRGLFEKPEGKKLLVFGPNIINLLNLCIESSALKEVGIV